MKKRKYGKNGIELSVIGFGGILVMNESAEDSARVVSKAVDAGINYFDVAPQYGNAQDMLGPALKPFRKDVFLACKTLERTADEARRDLEESLRLLKTDYFDLYQLHSVTTREDVDLILGPSGALELFEEARRNGLVRHLGFSAHSEDAALALLDAFDFDSVLFPLNVWTWHAGDFGKRVLDKTAEKNVTVLALKSLAKRRILEDETGPVEKAWYWPVESYEEALVNLRFTLGLPGVTAAVSPGDETLFDWMLKAGKEYSPLSEAEQEKLEKEAENYPLIFDAHHSGWQ